MGNNYRAVLFLEKREGTYRLDLTAIAETEIDAINGFVKTANDAKKGKWMIEKFGKLEDFE
jgi:hypothetical protein